MKIFEKLKKRNRRDEEIEMIETTSLESICKGDLYDGYDDRNPSPGTDLTFPI